MRFLQHDHYKKQVNKKIFNVSGGEKFRTTYKEYVQKVFKTYGLSLKFIASWLMAEKNYCGGYYSDGDELENILHFRSKNLSVYYNNTLAKYKNKISRAIPRLFALPFIYFGTRVKKDKKQRK